MNFTEVYKKTDNIPVKSAVYFYWNQLRWFLFTCCVCKQIIIYSNCFYLEK